MIYRYVPMSEVEHIFNEDATIIPYGYESSTVTRIGYEKKIVKLRVLNKLLFILSKNNGYIGSDGDMISDIYNNHFVYAVGYNSNVPFPIYDDNNRLIKYYSEESLAPYCEDANVIYSCHEVGELDLQERLSLFYKYY